jgi:hypothetical protein
MIQKPTDVLKEEVLRLVKVAVGEIHQYQAIPRVIAFLESVLARVTLTRWPYKSLIDV